jgi:membrane associated rhomboid family serine protease
VNDSPVGVPTCYRHPGRETWIRCQRCERGICPDCMNEAAVGFQCPECLAEGRKTVRQALAPYGGRPSANPALTSIVLIVLNAVVWIAVMATGGRSSRLIEWIALRPNGFCIGGLPSYDISAGECSAIDGALWVPGVADGAPWQLVTSIFAHVEPWHLGFNMLALWVLGPQLERVLGRARYLALYLLSGLAGSVAIYWLSPEYQSTLGASGAVFGLMGGLIVVGHKIGGQVQGLLMWLGINVALTFLVPNVSWQGHFGGLVGGGLIAALLVYAPKQRRTAVQLGGLVLLGVLLAGATVARTLTLQ